MTLSRTFVTLALGASLAACSGTASDVAGTPPDGLGNVPGKPGGAGGSAPTPGNPGTPTPGKIVPPLPTPAVKPAATGFEKYLYETFKGSVGGAAKFDAQENGNNVFTADLFVLESGAFRLLYAEGKGDVAAKSHNIAVQSDRRFAVTGEWKVEGGRLILGDVASCAVSAASARGGLDCKLERAVGYPAAAGKTFLAENETNEPFDAPRIADYQSR